MGGICGIVHWNGRPVAEADLGAMLQRIRHRGPDGLPCEADGPVGLGAARLVVNAEDTHERQPVWLPDRTAALVADARLYNRPQLLEALTATRWLQADASNSAILLAGYERWGHRLLDRLDGDYAFAVWDQRKGCLFAARDPFGLRPFFYIASAAGFWFGTEPKQLVDQVETPIRLHDLVVGEVLAGAPKAYRKTVVEGIERLEPGHYLAASANGVVQRRYWKPAQLEPVEVGDRQELIERFRALISRAVAERLEARGPVAMQLSGGLDSSSLVALAGELERSDDPPASRVFTLSEVYPGLGCDESEYIAAVEATIPFACRRVVCSCSDANLDLRAQHAREDAPDGDLAEGRSRSIVGALESEGSRVLVTGLAGDELAWEPDWIPDLIRRGRALAAIREARASVSRRDEFAVVPALARGSLRVIPPGLRRFLGSLKRRPSAEGPPWVDQEFWRHWQQMRRRVATPVAGFPSFAQEQVHRWLTNPLTRWNLERAELRMAAGGIELRHPFLDRELVEFVLRIPWDCRYERTELRKPLLREAVGSLLPETVRERQEATVFDSYFEGLVAGSAGRFLEELRSTEAWCSRVYTRRTPLERRLQSVVGGGSLSQREALQIWGACNLEIWMRSQRRIR